MADWTEIIITVNADNVDLAGDIAQMVVPYGIYTEDYRFLEQEAREIANIDLIDEELLAKDRSIGKVHIYISPEENPAEAVSFLRERFQSEGIDYSIDESLCKNADWENNWKKYFHQFYIDDMSYDDAEKLYERILSLPLFPAMTDDTVKDVVRAVKKVLNYYKK